MDGSPTPLSRTSSPPTSGPCCDRTGSPPVNLHSPSKPRWETGVNSPFTLLNPSPAPGHTHALRAFIRTDRRLSHRPSHQRVSRERRAARTTLPQAATCEHDAHTQHKHGQEDCGRKGRMTNPYGSVSRFMLSKRAMTAAGGASFRAASAPTICCTNELSAFTLPTHSRLLRELTPQPHQVSRCDPAIRVHISQSWISSLLESFE